MISSTGMVAATGRLLGWAAVAASLAYVGLQLWRDAPWELAALHARPLAAAVLCGALFYGLAGFLLSSAWHHLLGAGRAGTQRRLHHVVYGRTQIAKYLPGNVFHLVGRQILGRRLGHTQGQLALASALETLLLLMVAGCLSLRLLSPSIDTTLLSILIGTSIVLVLIVTPCRCARPYLALPCFVVHINPKSILGPRSIASLVLRPVLLYAGFFLVTAAVLWLIVMSVSGSDTGRFGFAESISVVAFAWLIGFVTPGSSAGIGIREAVLITTLESTLGPAASGLVAIALRVASTGGDGLFFALASGIAPSADKAEGLFADRSVRSMSR